MPFSRSAGRLISSLSCNTRCNYVKNKKSSYIWYMQQKVNDTWRCTATSVLRLRLQLQVYCGSSYGCIRAVTTGVLRQRLWVYQDSDYRHIADMSTGVSYTYNQQVRSYYEDTTGILKVWAYHGCDYGYGYRLATSA